MAEAVSDLGFDFTSCRVEIGVRAVPANIDRTIRPNCGAKRFDPRHRRIDDHAQLRLIRPVGQARLTVERADGEPILAVAFGPVIERFDMRLGFADFLPAAPRSLDTNSHTACAAPARRPKPIGRESGTAFCFQ